MLKNIYEFILIVQLFLVTLYEENKFLINIHERADEINVTFYWKDQWKL